jgi:kynurenine formamidase
MADPRHPQPLLPEQVLALHGSLSNWGRWGERDQLGALNLITPERRAAAARLVATGRLVSCARPLPTEAAPDNPSPVVHLMTGTQTESYGGDYFAIAPHGMATSHIDALCHIFHEGKIYNGYSTETVTAHGAMELGIHELRDGVVSRGVLLDVPLARGVNYLEPGDRIFPSDLEKAESDAGIEVSPGDILLVSTGRFACLAERGAWDSRQLLAGLDASCLAWLHQRGVAALGSDGVSDVIPSGVAGHALPIHSVAIVAMGLHLLDNLELRDLCAACAEAQRWEFLLTVAPLVLRRGTASPVNPIALF